MITTWDLKIDMGDNLHSGTSLTHDGILTEAVHAIASSHKCNCKFESASDIKLIQRPSYYRAYMDKSKNGTAFFT